MRAKEKNLYFAHILMPFSLIMLSKSISINDLNGQRALIFSRLMGPFFSVFAFG